MAGAYFSRRIHNAGKDGGGNTEALEQRCVPFDCGRVDQGRDGGIGGVSDVQRVGSGRCAARKNPGHPGVHRTEAQLPGDGPRAIGVDRVEDGHEFGRRGVGGKADPLGLEFEARPDGAQVLPSDPGGKRHPRGPFPHDARGPLVGYAHRIHRAPVAECCVRHREDGVGHARRVELHQTRCRRVREDRCIVRMRDRRVGSNDGGAHTRGPDVDDENAAAVGIHDQGEGPKGDGKPSFPGLRMPTGSKLSLSPTSTSKPEPRARGKKRERLSPMP